MRPLQFRWLGSRASTPAIQPINLNNQKIAALSGERGERGDHSLNRTGSRERADPQAEKRKSRDFISSSGIIRRAIKTL